MKKLLTIATRDSLLALWQAEWVKAQILKNFPGVEVRLEKIKTQGDKILDTPLSKIGGKGLFVKELEVAMLEGRADIAVHSMKDVPAELPEGLEISVITERETPDDAFVSNRYKSFKDLPPGAVLGTSSLRRGAQALAARPDLKVESLRGNVQTRLRKLDENQFDGIMLAAAGLVRLELQERIAELMDHQTCLPALCQGIVGIESRVGDLETLELITALRHQPTEVVTAAERGLLKRLNGGCQVPFAGEAILLDNGRIKMEALVATPDGTQVIRLQDEDDQANAAQLGLRLAERLLESGAREILSALGIETH
ncbi:MAG: hydroxymethylbilane synthase [bacterium]|nr:hydroxymethylbilane synthase [bacterium]